MYPFTCAWAVRAAPTATLSGAEEGSKSTRPPEQRQARGARSKGTRWAFPGKSLAGATCPTPARPPPLSLRVPTPSTTLEPRLGRHRHGGMQIFVKTKGLRGLDRNQKTRQQRGSLPRMPTRPRQGSCRRYPRGPGKTLAKGARKAPARPLQGISARPRQGLAAPSPPQLSSRPTN